MHTRASCSNSELTGSGSVCGYGTSPPPTPAVSGDRSVVPRTQRSCCSYSCPRGCGVQRLHDRTRSRRPGRHGSGPRGGQHPHPVRGRAPEHEPGAGVIRDRLHPYSAHTRDQFGVRVQLFRSKEVFEGRLLSAIIVPGSRLEPTARFAERHCRVGDAADELLRGLWEGVGQLRRHPGRRRHGDPAGGIRRRTRTAVADRASRRRMWNGHLRRGSGAEGGLGHVARCQ